MPAQGTDTNDRLYLQAIKSDGSAYENIYETSNALWVYITGGSGATFSGDVAHDAADSGNPMKIGTKAYDLPGTPPAAVTAGDRANGISDLYGRLAIIQDLVQAVPDAAAPAQAITVAATANVAAPTPDEGDSIALSTNLFSEMRVTNESVEGTHDSAKPARIMMVGAACQATADTPDDGDAADLSLTTGNELRVIQENLTGTHDAAKPTKMLVMGGVCQATADTPDDGDAAEFSLDTGNQLRVIHESVLDIQPAGSTIAMAASAARTTSSNSADFDIGGFDTVTVVLDVTAAATDAGDTLDVSIEALDGSTYIEVLHFTQVLGNGGAKRFVATIKAEQLAIADISTATLAAGNIRHFLTDTIRAKWAIVDSGDANQSFTFSVNAYCK